MYTLSMDVTLGMHAMYTRIMHDFARLSSLQFASTNKGGGLNSYMYVGCLDRIWLNSYMYVGCHRT